jgi:ferritin-like metal-binding protein YciE
MFEKLNSLDDLLLHEVQDMYHAEKQVVKALPDVAEQAASPELKSALEEHLQQTKVHVNRLERVFEMLGQEPKATKCKAMKGILDEGEDTISEKGSSEAIDAAIIMSAQKVEHYEIAAYGSLAAWADMLGRQDIKQLFGQTLDEEKAADEKLTELAKAGLNQRAASMRPEKQFAE